MSVTNLDSFLKSRAMTALLQQFWQTTACCLSSGMLVLSMMDALFCRDVRCGLMTLMLRSVVPAGS